MNANVSFRHMDSSPALREYAVQKLERVVGKYVHGRTDASIVMTVEKFRHIVNFTVQIKNLTVKGDSSSEDMYSSIDLALDKIERQLRRHKDRLRDHKPSQGRRGKSFRMSVLEPPAPEEVEEVEALEDEIDLYAPSEAVEEAAAVEGVVEAPVEEEAAPVAEDDGTVGTFKDSHGGDVAVLRAGDYEAKSMTLDEAVLQLDLLTDREFFVFTNAESQVINIIYKRADGRFGLIET